jgi:hypothetical protein
VEAAALNLTAGDSGNQSQCGVVANLVLKPRRMNSQKNTSEAPITATLDSRQVVIART